MMLTSADIRTARKKAASPAINMDGKRGTTPKKRTALDIFTYTRRKAPSPQSPSPDSPTRSRSRSRSRANSMNLNSLDPLNSKLSKHGTTNNSVPTFNGPLPHESNSNLNANPQQILNHSNSRSRATSMNYHYSGFDGKKSKSLQYPTFPRSKSSPNLTLEYEKGLQASHTIGHVDRKSRVHSTGIVEKKFVVDTPEVIDILSPMKKNTAGSDSSYDSIQNSVIGGNFNVKKLSHKSKRNGNSSAQYIQENLASSIPVLYYGEPNNTANANNSSIINSVNENSNNFSLRVPNLNPVPNLHLESVQPSPVNQPSLFNETLLSTASPNHLNRSSTVVRYKNTYSSKNTPTDYDSDNTPYSEKLTDGLTFNEAQNIEKSLNERQSTIIAPPSNYFLSKKKTILQRSNSHKIYKNGILDTISPLTASSKNSPKSPSYDIHSSIVDSASLDLPMSQNVTSSILHPLRNPNDVVKQNSFFTEAGFNVKTGSASASSRKMNSSNVNSPLAYNQKGLDFTEKDEIYMNTSPGFKLEQHLKGVDPDPDPENAFNEKVYELLKKGTKKSKITIAFLVAVIVILALICVPSIILLVKGTASSVHNYFASHPQDVRENMISDLVQKYNISQIPITIPFDDEIDFGDFESDLQIHNKKNSPREKKMVNSGTLVTNNATHIRKKGAIMGGYNSFEGLNAKYQSDEEIKEIMTDSRFKGPVFYGIGYAPRNVIYPICGVDFRDVALDLAIISKLTTRVRSYGMQCNQSNLILDALSDLGLNMTLSMGVWIGSDEKINKEQMKEMETVMSKYPRHLFESILIGNEVKFREDQTSEQLVKYIKQAKEFAHSLGWDDLPIGTSEIGSKVDSELVNFSDVIGTNIHPFFSGENVKLATEWTLDFMKYQIEPLKVSTKNKDTQFVISEVGWPYKGGSYLDAIAGPKHMQYFLDNWVCEAYKNDYPWYWFEAFDEPWKKMYHEEGKKWETEWGFFTQERKFKDGITIPNCY